MKLLRLIYYLEFKRFKLNWKDTSVVVVLCLLLPYYFTHLIMTILEYSELMIFRIVCLIFGSLVGSIVFTDNSFRNKHTFFLIHGLRFIEIAKYFIMKWQLTPLFLLWTAIEGILIAPLDRNEKIIFMNTILLIIVGYFLFGLSWLVIKKTHLWYIAICNLLLIPILYMNNKEPFTMLYLLILCLIFNSSLYIVMKIKHEIILKIKKNKKIKIRSKFYLLVYKDISLLCDYGRIILCVLVSVFMELIFYTLGAQSIIFLLASVTLLFFLHDIFTLNSVGIEGQCIYYYRSFPRAILKLTIIKWGSMMIVTHIVGIVPIVIWGIYYGYYEYIGLLFLINILLGTVFLAISYHFANFNSSGLYRVHIPAIIISVILFVGTLFCTIRYFYF